MHTPPDEVKGTSVTALQGSEQEYQNEQWITLIPDDENDPRIWEFSLTTGRIIQTKFE